MIPARSLGDSGLSVTALGLGLAALGRPGYINVGHAADLAGRSSEPALASHTAAMLDHAVACGVGYLDAARSYGKAEAFLSAWLEARNVAPSVVVVGSKWGYTYTADWRVDAEVHEVKDHSVATLERQLARSTALLGNHLNLYQIHSATLETGVLDDDAVLGRLGELRDAGVAVGLSTSGPQQAAVVQKAIELRAGGSRLFASVQSTWNLLEPSVGAALQEAAEAGLGVIVKEAVANGRLTSRNPDLPDPLRRTDYQPDAIALAAAVAQPWASVVLSGAATIAQLDSNLSALDVPDEVVVELPDLAMPPEEYWAKRSGMPWT